MSLFRGIQHKHKQGNAASQFVRALWCLELLPKVFRVELAGIGDLEQTVSKRGLVENEHFDAAAGSKRERAGGRVKGDSDDLHGCLFSARRPRAAKGSQKFWLGMGRGNELPSEECLSCRLLLPTRRAVDHTGIHRQRQENVNIAG